MAPNVAGPVIPATSEDDCDRPNLNAKTPVICVALPAYNEREGLPHVLARWADLPWGDDTLPADWRVIVVDDGSRDGTDAVLREWADRINLQAVTHDVNQGLGPTVRDALEAAANQAEPDDWVVVMDADNTQPPELLPRMLEKARAADLDIVIASRFQPGAKVHGVNFSRRLTTWGAAVLFRLLACVPGARDYTCGFRLYRASLLRRAFDEYGPRFCSELGFACMVQMLLQLASLGATFGEVPLTLHYEDKAGASKMPVAATIRRTFKLLLRYRFGGKA